MSSENNEGSEGKRFSHISVDQTPRTSTSFDDEEVFDIGGASEPASPVYPAEQRGGYGSAPTPPERQHRHGAAERFDERTSDDPDYSVDDLPPMSGIQKVVLFVVIAIVVVVGAWLFNYYTGGSFFQ